MDVAKEYTTFSKKLKGQAKVSDVGACERAFGWGGAWGEIRLADAWGGETRGKWPPRERLGTQRPGGDGLWGGKP